jgi:hypothetical protein
LTTRPALARARLRTNAAAIPVKKSPRVAGSGDTVAVPPKLVFSGKPSKSRVKSVWKGIDPSVKLNSVPPPMRASTPHMANGLPDKNPQKSLVGSKGMVGASKISEVTVAGVPLLEMSFSKRHCGEVVVMPPCIRTQGLVAGLVPLGEVIVKLVVMMPAGTGASIVSVKG